MVYSIQAAVPPSAKTAATTAYRHSLHGASSLACIRCCSVRLCPTVPSSILYIATYVPTMQEQTMLVHHSVMLCLDRDLVSYLSACRSVVTFGQYRD